MSKPDTPLVSVIIPAYNYARFLPCAVKSVQAQSTDGVATEILIVDDGSTDNTAAEAQAFGAAVRYIYQENQGLSAARNTGLRAARGEYLVFLDADDLLGKGNLASHLRLFAARPDLEISVCLCLQTFESREASDAFWPLMQKHLDLHLCNANISPVHTFMLRSQTAAQVGFFDVSLGACEDQDFWLRCAVAGKIFACNPEGLVIYRKHGQSMTNRHVRQLVYDAAMHSKVGKALDETPDFPKAGKFSGWLAHAAGTLACASQVLAFNPALGERLLAEFARAVEQAAQARALCAHGREEAELEHIRLCHALQILLNGTVCNRRHFPAAHKALYMVRRMFKDVLRDTDPSALQARHRKLLRRLCVEPEKMLAALAKAHVIYQPARDV
ncbi:glycosyltransferase [Desulfovibrio sp. ZJ369]|uniref:glycosyltransferase family 2 protein n=1 Tax=Desulfovibrio sp. ZJ369 TaxID=2709793 RepID=UPI0013EDC05C|nr:glycosyltransferase [Desulfovibrio sp. ZJ369]